MAATRGSWERLAPRRWRLEVFVSKEQRFRMSGLTGSRRVDYSPQSTVVRPEADYGTTGLRGGPAQAGGGRRDAGAPGLRGRGGSRGVEFGGVLRLSARCFHS